LCIIVRTVSVYCELLCRFHCDVYCVHPSCDCDQRHVPINKMKVG